MRPTTLHRLIKMSCLFVFTTFFTANTFATQDLSKYHALFIGKFTDYIEWPQGKDQLVIGVLGNSAVFDELQASLGQRGKASIKKVSGPGDLANCQVVFIPASENKQFDAIYSAVNNKDILLVTESEQFARKGAAISFYLDSGKLRFFLNESATKDHNLKVSSGLTSLATVL